MAIAAGDRLRISTDPAMAEDGDETCLWADHPTLDTDLEVGQLVFLDDGLLQLEVVGHVSSRAVPSVAAASRAVFRSVCHNSRMLCVVAAREVVDRKSSPLICVSFCRLTW